MNNHAQPKGKKQRIRHNLQKISKLIQEFNQEWDQYYGKCPSPADLSGGVSVMSEQPTNIIVVDFNGPRKPKDKSKKNREKENKKVIKDWRLGPKTK